MIERTRTDSSGMTLPAWSSGDRTSALTVLALLIWGVAALLLALVGWLHWWTVAPLAIVGFVVTRRLIPKAAKRWDAWWILAMVIVLGIVVLNTLHPAEHLFTGRDGGTYLATAGWLAQEGSLLVDAEVGPLTVSEELEFVVPGFYDRVGGRDHLEPQFMHMFPAMTATLIDIGGVGFGLVLNAFIGGVVLLALFGLARRFVRPWIALAAMLSVGSSLVFLYYSRAPFTELLMAVFIVGGLWFVGLGEQRRESSLLLLGGILLGAATAVRLDGIVLLIPATAYFLVRSVGDPDLERGMRMARYGMYLAAFVGLADSLYVSPAYILERSGNVAPVLVAVLILLVGFDLLKGPFGRLSRVMVHHKRSLYIAAVTVLGVLLLYAWFIRPVVVEAAGGGYDLTALQEREGLELDENRSYAEQSVRWVVWYQGAAFVLLAFAGAAVLGGQEIFSKAARPGWLLAGVLGVYAVLYFWAPSINPDQIWAMRRFLPVVIPLGAIAASVAVESGVRAISRYSGSRALTGAVGGVLSLSLVIPAVVTTAPVWDIDEFQGLSGDFAQLCEDLGPDAYVIITDERLGLRFSQSFRSYCGIPAAWSTQIDSAELDAIHTAVEDAGGQLVLVGSEGPGTRYLDRAYEFLENTLSRAPKEPLEADLSVTVRAKGD